MDTAVSRQATQPPGTAITFPIKNNLDLLRLALAAQVVVVHTLAHFRLPPLLMLEHIPGVPGFFFLSGFLIYPSYLNTTPTQYAVNRFLRLFPALLAVTIGGACVALLGLGWSDLLAHPALYMRWIVAQTTLGQAYNPAHFRSVGVGVINGSLWTLTVEILFYAAVPVIVFLEKRFRFTVIALGAVSFLLYAFGPRLLDQPIGRHDKTLYDLLALTPLVWGWMFAAGILAVRHFHRLPVRRLWIGALVMVLIAAANIQNPLLNSFDNSVGLIYFAGYAATLLWFGFAVRRIELPFDFSYGLYIWHMPVINTALILGLGPWSVAATAPAAIASWFFIESPCLKLKRRTLRRSPMLLRPQASAEKPGSSASRRSA